MHQAYLHLRDNKTKSATETYLFLRDTSLIWAHRPDALRGSFVWKIPFWSSFSFDRE